MKIIFLLIILLFFVELGCAQQIVDNKMNNIDYIHNIPQSFEAKLIENTMSLIKMKKKLQKKMINNGFVKYPAKISKSLKNNFIVNEKDFYNKKVWTISPKDTVSELVILFLHGGAYISNINNQHWSLVEQLLIKTKATIVIPDYPLAPENNCLDTYIFIENLYAQLVINYSTKNIIFIGDSAGAGLAFGFAQKIKNEKIKQPVEIILFSPWLDITMSNPDIIDFDKNDKLLSIEGLKSAGEKYSAKEDPKDFKLSPIYGDFTGLCRISIFIGTNDILIADARKCKNLMQEKNICFNYFEYPKMYHDWVIFTNLKESIDVINKVAKLTEIYK